MYATIAENAGFQAGLVAFLGASLESSSPTNSLPQRPAPAFAGATRFEANAEFYGRMLLTLLNPRRPNRARWIGLYKAAKRARREMGEQQ